MAVPGFSAQASLYDASGTYWTGASAGASTAVTGVIAAFPRTTTREICTACGCVASFFNCHCGREGSPLTDRRLRCIEDKNARKVALAV